MSSDNKSMQRDLARYAKDYEKLPFENILIKYRKRKILEILNRFKCKSILEIGCGMDPLFNHFEDYNFFVTVEPCVPFFENAVNERKKTNDKTVTVINDIFENAAGQLAGNKFDIIIISCLLHELADPELFIRKVISLATADTIIHINVPNAKSLHRILAVKSSIIRNEFNISDTQKTMQQFVTYDLTSLTSFLAKNGSVVFESGSYFLKPFTHSQMQDILDHNIIGPEVLDGFYNIIDDLPDWGAEIFVNARIAGDI